MTQTNLNPDTLRRHNIRNTLHTWLLIVATGLIMGVMAYSVFGIAGLAGATLFGVIGIASLSRVSPKMVLGLYKARPITGSELPELQKLVRELAAKADLSTVPMLYYVPTKMLNAFAVGTKDDSAIAITDGLLRTMNMRQLAGILAHETAHIMNGDLKVMGLADVLNRITSFLSTMGLIGIPIVFGTGLNIPLLGLLLMVFAPTIGGMLQLGLSRAREYDADLDGVTLTGDPDGLASALNVLEAQQKGLWEGMFLPGSRLPQPSILRSHPKTEDRIARITALRKDGHAQSTVHNDHDRPKPSFVPAVQNPRIRWQRLGIYF
jgi:heat shock protein HtpX